MRFRTLVSALVLTFALAATVPAQTVTRKSLSLQGAEAVIAAAKAEAHRLQAPGAVIAVVDEGGNLMALQRLDGTFAAGANISIGKARTAVLFKKPTRFFEELINSSGKGRTVMTALNDFTPLIGGIPITIDGEIVGGVGVSGAASATQDEELALAGAQALTSAPSQAAAVSYFDHAAVDAAFAKGAVLLDGNARNFMVHASRREQPGMAEIHEQDADIIYVVEGTATIVTGGASVNAKPTGPGELRGDSIRDGRSQALAKGDVMVIPAGTPHQFVQVSDPFLYYVVKVR